MTGIPLREELRQIAQVGNLEPLLRRYGHYQNKTIPFGNQLSVMWSDLLKSREGKFEACGSLARYLLVSKSERDLKHALIISQAYRDQVSQR